MSWLWVSQVRVESFGRRIGSATALAGIMVAAGASLAAAAVPPMAASSLAAMPPITVVPPMTAAQPAGTAHPIGTSPATDVVARAPLAVSVTFDRPLRGSGAQLRILGPGGGDAGTGAVTTADRTLRRTLRLGIPAGDYRVVWTAISHAGHKMHGSFEFTAARGNQDPLPGVPGAVANPGANTEPAQTSSPAPVATAGADSVSSPVPGAVSSGASSPGAPGASSAVGSSPAVSSSSLVPGSPSAAASPAAVTQTAIAAPGYTLGASVPGAKPPADQGVSSGFGAVPLIVGAVLVVAAGAVSVVNRRRMHV